MLSGPAGKLTPILVWTLNLRPSTIDAIFKLLSFTVYNFKNTTIVIKFNINKKIFILKLVLRLSPDLIPPYNLIYSKFKIFSLCLRANTIKS
jgi:hypothetical protein